MQVIKSVDHMTSDSLDLTSVDELIGMEKPHAFLINYQAQGYAKFIVDDHTLNAFETSLFKIKDSLSRLQNYFMLYHMVKFNNIPGSRAMQIIINNIA